MFWQLFKKHRISWSMFKQGVVKWFSDERGYGFITPLLGPRLSYVVLQPEFRPSYFSTLGMLEPYLLPERSARLHQALLFLAFVVLTLLFSM